MSWMKNSTMVLQLQHTLNNVLSLFHLVDVDIVSSHIKKTFRTICPLNPIIISKLFSVYNYTHEFITKIVDRCFSEGYFCNLKSMPCFCLFSRNLDLMLRMPNYCPVSNLSFFFIKGSITCHTWPTAITTLTE